MYRKEWHRSRTILEAFYFALRGLRDTFVREQNVRIQTIIGTLVVCAMLFLRVSLVEMVVAILAIILVLTLEMINTSLELVCDIIHPEYSEAVKKAKDIAAAAVLLASIGACIIGIAIFASAILHYY